MNPEKIGDKHVSYSIYDFENSSFVREAAKRRYYFSGPAPKRGRGVGGGGGVRA